MMGVDARGARSRATKDASVSARRTTSCVARRRRRRRRAASSSSSRAEEIAGKRGDRPNDTLARGADARDEGGDFLPRVE